MESGAASSCVAIGELLWDLLPVGARLGGTTTNFAVLSARLGEFTALVSCVGNDDLGRKAVELLRTLADDLESDAHLDLTGVQTSTELPTGTVAVTLDDQGHPHYEIVTPVAWDAITLSPMLLSLAVGASAICFGTLAQRHALSRGSIRAFLAAAPPQCIRICDLNLRQPFCTTELLQWCLAHADVLKVSEEELPEVGRLLGEPSLMEELHSSDFGGLTQAAHNAIAVLLQRAPQCQMVAVTLGARGSLLASRSETHLHQGFRVDVADTIGAGDAFTAGMVHAYLRGASLSQINDIANRCGSYVASRPGATPALSESLLESIRNTLRPTA